MADKPPLDVLLEQCAMLLKEMELTAGLVLGGLRDIILSLQTGRAPRALGLGEKIRPEEEGVKVLQEILSELKFLDAPLGLYVQDLGAKNSASPDVQELARHHSALQRELGFWQKFLEGCHLLVKKLRLISDEEKLSLLARRPIEEAWEEVRGLAINR